MHLILQRRRRHVRLPDCFAGVLLLALATGCNDGGVAPATGTVIIEGQPVTSGRLSLLPVSEGVRADSLVAEDGAFAFRTDGALGAVPGSYRVVYTRSHGADAASQGTQVNAAIADEQTVVYQSPPEEPLLIPESGSEQLIVDIRNERGWTRTVSE